MGGPYDVVLLIYSSSFLSLYAKIRFLYDNLQDTNEILKKNTRERKLVWRGALTNIINTNESNSVTAQ